MTPDRSRIALGLAAATARFLVGDWRTRASRPGSRRWPCRSPARENYHPRHQCAATPQWRAMPGRPRRIVRAAGPGVAPRPQQKRLPIGIFPRLTAGRSAVHRCFFIRCSMLCQSHIHLPDPRSGRRSHTMGSYHAPVRRRFDHTAGGGAGGRAPTASAVSCVGAAKLRRGAPLAHHIACLRAGHPSPLWSWRRRPTAISTVSASAGRPQRRPGGSRSQIARYFVPGLDRRAGRFYMAQLKRRRHRPPGCCSPR